MPWRPSPLVCASIPRRQFKALVGPDRGRDPIARPTPSSTSSTSAPWNQNGGSIADEKWENASGKSARTAPRSPRRSTGMGDESADLLWGCEDDGSAITHHAGADDGRCALRGAVVAGIGLEALLPRQLQGDHRRRQGARLLGAQFADRLLPERCLD